MPASESCHFASTRAFRQSGHHHKRAIHCYYIQRFHRRVAVTRVILQVVSDLGYRTDSCNRQRYIAIFRINTSGASLGKHRAVLATFIWAATRLLAGVSIIIDMARDLGLGSGRFPHCYVAWLSTVQRSACSDTRALFKCTQSVDFDIRIGLSYSRLEP